MWGCCSWCRGGRRPCGSTGGRGCCATRRSSTGSWCAGTGPVSRCWWRSSRSSSTARRRSSGPACGARRPGRTRSGCPRCRKSSRTRWTCPKPLRTSSAITGRITTSGSTPNGASPQPDERCWWAALVWLGSGRGSHGQRAARHWSAHAVGGPLGPSPRPELEMTVARSVADVLDDRVTLEVESIDRLYCNLYVPQLQHVNGVVGFFRGHRGMPFASSALMDPISKDFVAGIHRFCRDHDVPMVDFVKGQRKDDVAHEYLARFTGEEGVLFVGRAQEKTRVFRTEKRRNPDTGASYPWIVSATGIVNHFYVYAVDADALQRICDRLTPAKIDALVRKWLRRLPHPFTAADRAAGYRYDISILQAEFCLTQVFDRPATGRVFFEEVIRENLDLVRPDRVGLVFNRSEKKKRPRKTPGRFRTRVQTAGVTPSLHIDYK